MEEINVKELCSVSSSTVQSNNGISWSKDHKVSLISASGLHVFEVAPSTSVTTGDMCLKKNIIKPTGETPTADSGIDTSRLIFNLEQRDVYRLLLDMKLAPHLPDAKVPEPRFLTAQWSPASMYQDHRCIIATLTCTGCLKLHVPHFNCWVEVFDISKYWVKHCKEQWTDHIDETNDASATFAILQKRTSQLKITGMVWGNMVELNQERFSPMATVTHKGTLTLWKVNHLLDLGVSAKNYCPKILTSCETNLYNANTLHWMQWNEDQISVIIGDSKGCVSMVTFSFNKSDDTTSVLKIQEIWKEKDLMQVSCIRSLPHSSLCHSKQRILGVTKNSYLLVFLITQGEVVSYCHSHLGGLPLTGLEVYNDEAFIVCTLSGVICKYNVRVEQMEENYKLFTSSKILKSNFSWQEVACLGISKNSNNHVWTLCTNLCKMYDHLVMRRPSQVVFCTISEEDVLKDSNNKMSAKIAASKLRFNWESLEIFRMNYLKELKTQPPKEYELRQDLENISITELQMELWRARIVVNHLVMADLAVKNPEACAYVTLLEELILCRHACKYICSLMERHKTESLDDKSLQSLGLLRLWLRTWLSHNKPMNNITDKNSETKTTVIAAPNVSNSNVANVSDAHRTNENKFEMDTSDNAQMSTPSTLSGASGDVSENVGDDAISICSLDDAISTDSNSSSAVSDKTIITKRLQIQQGRVPASFLKAKLVATSEQVSSVLALPVVPGTLEKELCVFCEQEVQMDIDWRSSICPANHRLSRCCHCLSRCHRMPYRLCAVCPTVACLDVDLEPFCTFCDSPLIVDEKFKKPGFTPPEEQTEEPIGENDKTIEEKMEEKSEERKEKKTEEEMEHEEENISVKKENTSEVCDVPMDTDS